MKLGIIGCGVVGGTLYKWLEKNTTHTLVRFDPGLSLYDNLDGCDAIFVSVPVPANESGQDLTILTEAVTRAKQFTSNVYIRSTVLPGTNDKLGTFAMPEFLTERCAYEEFDRLPILVGNDAGMIQKIFPDKKKIYVTNVEAELAKFTHNCFGAMKVTYFNIIEELSRSLSADYANVLMASMLTGFIELQHTMVPGPDGKRGYGGSCFPHNIEAITGFLASKWRYQQCGFFEAIKNLNHHFRGDNV